MKVTDIRIAWSGVGALLVGFVLFVSASSCSAESTGSDFIALPFFAYGVLAGLGFAVAAGRHQRSLGAGVLVGLVVAAAWLFACANLAILLGASSACGS